MVFIFFLMIRRPPRSTLDRSSAASDVYKRQERAAVDDDDVAAAELGQMVGGATADNACADDDCPGLSAHSDLVLVYGGRAHAKAQSGKGRKERKEILLCVLFFLCAFA